MKPLDDAGRAMRLMTDRMRHRGPDASGSWISPSGLAAFGHTRLSILDLSSAGAQPMLSRSLRYAVTYNGEIYNHKALRASMVAEGYPDEWRGRSDTEVLLAAIEHWGVGGAARRIRGMFAFAVWDETNKKLSVVRDRIGIKPVYVASLGAQLAFASELSAIAALGRFSVELNREAVSEYVQRGFFVAPSTVYKQAAQMLPGSILSITLPDHAVDASDAIRAPAHLANSRSDEVEGTFWSCSRYWSAASVWKAGAIQSRESASSVQAAADLDNLLRSAIAESMVADVPLGAFLSGGIDSSLVVAIMQSLSPTPIRTFTIGFEGTSFDESAYARETAAYLHTDHTEFHCKSSDAAELAPQLASFLDQPLGDSSILPTYLVSRLSRAEVAVVMTGDGGDEVFGGYPWYRWMRPVSTAIERSSRTRRMVALCMRLLGAKERRPGAFGRFRFRMGRLESLLGAESFPAAYQSLMTAPHASLVLLSDPSAGVPRSFEQTLSADPSALMTFWDTTTLLPNDFLTKVDRASMAVSLECRVPLLDHRVIEFAAGLPLGLKVGLRRGKILPRAVLRKYLDARRFDRPKKGFSIPVARWLRGPLRAWADHLLGIPALRSDGIWRPDRVRDLWRAHCENVADCTPLLWHILTLRQWLETHPWS